MNYIKKFQNENGLIADGIIGKHTISKMKDVFGITSNTAIAHFLGQIAEETGNFMYGKENLNYSVRGLRNIFGRYFTYKESLAFAHKPKLIANRVYDDRNPKRINKLGNIYDGDGWRYIGRGAIQITGRNKYQRFSEYIGENIMDNTFLAETKYFWQTALFVFNEYDIWKYTNKVNIWNIKQITKKINGGYNGLQHRINLTKHFYSISKNLK